MSVSLPDILLEGKTLTMTRGVTETQNYRHSDV